MAENYGTLEGTLDEHGMLSGEMSDRATLEGEIQFGSGGGGVLDVFQNGQSVVQGRYAYVTVPTFLKDLRSDDYHNTVTTLEIQNWNGKADPSDIPTALSQLDNDDNYVQDADYHHTDNNFTNEDKAAIGGIPENITDLSDVAVDNIQNGQVLKWDATQEKFVNANESGGGSGDVADVKVNGTSVVDPVTKEANIDLTGYAETSDIPTDLADLSDDSTHRLVTDTEKSTWDNKADVSDIPTVNNNTITIQKNGQNVDSFTLNQNSNKAINIVVPTKTSDLQNDSSFITNTVNNLANYYLKTDTYTQTEVNNLISAAVNGRFEKVTTLPASGEPNVIYLVPKTTALTNNVYDEYIWQDNAWELLGSTEIDLSNYVTTTDLSTALADYVTSSTFNTTIANYYTKTEVGNLLDGKVDKVSGKGLSTYDYDATAKGIVDNVTTNLAGKVDKVNGKGLSTEDYTTTEKNKLAGISTGANKVESSTTNGNIRIDGTETQVYDGSGKVDKVNGKGLSTNDYDNTAKGIVDGVTAALADKVDKETGKGLSTNDYTTNEKNKLAGIAAGATKTASSTTNGNIKINDVETPVYRNYGNNAVLTTDKTPFLTRQTLNPTGFSGYVREKLIGASYAWNQLVMNGNFTNTNDWVNTSVTTSASGNILTVTNSTGSGTYYSEQCISGGFIPNHKYLFMIEAKSGISSSGSSDKLIELYYGTADDNYFCYSTDNNWHKYSTIFSAASTIIYRMIRLCAFSIGSNQFKNCIIVDLTLAFGSTIADYLYSLTNNGGITKLRDMGCPIDKYTPYGYGLYSVKTSGKKIVGKNLVERLIKGYNIASNGSIGADASYDLCIAKVIEGKQYAITSNSGTYVYAFFTESPQTTSASYNNSRAVTSANSFTSPINGWVAFRKTTAMDTPQLELGSTSTTYEPYSSTTYSLGNDELRGKFDLVDGEIVASGDVKESNGGITRNWKLVDLGSLNYDYISNGTFFQIQSAMSDIKASATVLSAKYVNDVPSSVNSDNMIIGVTSSKYLRIRDTAYTDATTFKTALNGVYAIVELATPTTEQSTPFADPMSLVGATTEEYIDTRDIPCPVGAERQYMGQSEDVIEIPSMPQSDGIRYMKTITSGGKTQLVWEDDIIEDVSDCFTEGNAYTSIGFCEAYKVNRTVTFRMRYTKSMDDSTNAVFIMLSAKIRPLMPYQSCFRLDSSGLGLIAVIDRGSGGGAIMDTAAVVNQQVNVSGTFLTKN